jgi:hypothetical protein
LRSRSNPAAFKLGTDQRAPDLAGAREFGALDVALGVPRVGADQRLRALRRPPWEFSALDWAVLRYQHAARRDVPLGRRPGVRQRSPWAAIAERRRPGPGRPSSLFTASIGTGRVDPQAEPVATGETIDFSDPERVRRHVLYGASLPGDGCMLVGREARLVFRLPQGIDSALILAMSLDAVPIAGRVRRQRLEVTVNGLPAARFALDAARPALLREGTVVPRAAVAGRDSLELTLRMPDATAAPVTPQACDERELSILLRDLVVREPVLCQPGQPLPLGVASGDESLVAGGWGVPEPGGRWTYGSRARLLLRVPDEEGPLAFEVEAHPVREHQRVDLSVNGGRRSRLRWDRSARHSAPVAASGEELVVDLHVRHPISPAELGRSEDTRPLGVFVHNVGVFAR